MHQLFTHETIENTVEVYHARITGKPQIILWYIAVIDGNYGSMPAYSKNLNNFGVQEMNAEEMRSTEGGSFWSAIGDAWLWLLNHSTGDGIKISI